MIATRFERVTVCLEGRCSIQLSYATPKSQKHVLLEFILKVGVAGFEPAASCSQSRRDSRATLHPEVCFQTFFGIGSLFCIYPELSSLFIM